ncbi:MAG: helix-turn-helix transcriptional regulator [Acidobacteriaceae bacterium]|nr:helix-turn-helix transcriptional regulator [Acidobacteriaceae bacterium]
MKLADKIRYLREVEGSLRGLGRAMTQGELVKAIGSETGQALSQSYLSQIESGSRPHLTNNTRLLLAKFFKVHPGYLVDDPDGYHAELMSDVRLQEDTLDLWLIGGAERFRKDPEVRRSLLEIARHEDSRRCLLLLECILATDGLADRLLEVLHPGAKANTESAEAAEVHGEKRVSKRLAEKRVAAKSTATTSAATTRAVKKSAVKKGVQR